MFIKPYIEEQRDKLIELRRHFHMYPEVSMGEYQTADKIEKELEALHIPHRRVGETGVLGIIGKQDAKRTIILRADIDALRIQDKKSEPYASKHDGVMHACGHDVHTAALLGAAKVLKEREAKLQGRIYLFFQQGEEFGQGARVFIQEGLVDGAEKVFGLHVSSDIAVGDIAVSGGPTNASVDHFTIKVHGKSAHVSTPHLGVDALYIAAQIVNALQGIVTRRTSPADTVVIGIGVLRAGEAYNIIAGEAIIEGTTRCYSQESRERTNQNICKVSQAIGEAFGADVTIEFEDFASPLVNDIQVSEEVKKIAGEIVGKEHVISKERSFGGDDFGEYLRKVPGTYAFIGTGNVQKQNTKAPQHANNYDVDEEGILIGANLYADYALSVLTTGE